MNYYRLEYDFEKILGKIPEETKQQYKSSGAIIYLINKEHLNRVDRDEYQGIKLSMSEYLQFGVGGIVAYSATVKYARDLGFLVLSDDKICVRADNVQAYIKAYFCEGDSVDRSETHRIPFEEHGFNVDAVTAGSDSDPEALETLRKEARKLGREVL